MSEENPALSRDRLKRLAENIRAMEAKDLLAREQSGEIARLRVKAAVHLYTVCSGFAQELNDLLGGASLQIDPPAFRAEDFRDPGPNLFQLNIRGRIVQVEFGATPELISTEEFRIPYVLSGAVRSFNQRMLEQTLVEEHLLFYCLEDNGSRWRFFDARTYRSASFDTDYLTSLFERLV